MTQEFEITQCDDTFEAKVLKEFEIDHAVDLDAAIAQDERAYEELCAAAKLAGFSADAGEFESGTGVDLLQRDQYAKAYELRF